MAAHSGRTSGQPRSVKSARARHSRLYGKLPEFCGASPNAERRQPTYRGALGMYGCLSVDLSCNPALLVDRDIKVVPFMVKWRCDEAV